MVTVDMGFAVGFIGGAAWMMGYQIQVILSEIIQDITPQFESKDDYRPFYDFIYSAYKKGKITKEEYEYHCKKLDNGDYSEFQTEVKSNG